MTKILGGIAPLQPACARGAWAGSEWGGGIFRTHPQSHRPHLENGQKVLLHRIE